MSGERRESGHGQENTNNQPQRKSWRERLFGPKTPKPVDLSDLPPAREPADVVLARTPLPDRVVTLNDVSIHNVPVNWGAMKRLGLAVNRLKETPIEKFEVEGLKPPTAVYPAVPLVASVIAHHYNSEIPILLPSEAEVMAIKPWLRDVSGFIGRFSPRLQHRFGRYIEKRADEVVEEASRNVLGRVDKLGEIDRPKARFVPELATIYDKVATIRHEDVEGWFEDYTQPVPVERNVEDLIQEMVDVKYGQDGEWLTQKRFPLITRVLRVSKFPPDTLDSNTSIAGSEILKGIRSFLQAKGMNPIKAPDPVKTFDIFDYETWGSDNVWRSLGETFKPDQIAAVMRELPGILMQVHEVLPESGPAVIKSVRTIAENVLILSKQGVSNADIAAAIFAKKSTK